MNMKHEEFDVIIVGTGAAGLFTALSFPSNYKIRMITKDIIENSDYSLSSSKLKNLGDYDSTYGKAGRSLMNDEFIVYNIAQTDIRYLIKLKG